MKFISLLITAFFCCCTLVHHCTAGGCLPLVPMRNGYWRCSTSPPVVNTECRAMCHRGYKLKGSASRRCQQDGTWSGTPGWCKAITCPYPPRPNDGYTQCSSSTLFVNTECKFKCRRGYKLEGSKSRRCQGDGTWSGTPAHCKETTCPPHPAVPLTQVSPVYCTTKRIRFDLLCHFICPSGYYFIMKGYHSHSVDNVCQVNGTWLRRSLGNCRDMEPPHITCPTDLKANTAPGKPTAEVSWSVKTSDNSISIDPSARVTVTSSHTSPHAFSVGKHHVKATATDSAGNWRQCSFIVNVKDLEPPKFQKCPADIIIECAQSECKVVWDRLIVTDNSDPAPVISCSHRNGALFNRGQHLVACQVRDRSLNRAECKFKVTVKGLACRRYASPKNGVLVCHEVGEDRLCQVQCNSRYDVSLPLAQAFMCSGGRWSALPMMPGGSMSTVPWPDCNVVYHTGNPRKLGFGSSNHYYTGSASDPVVNTKIKQNFMTVMTRELPFCNIFKCNMQSVRVYTN